MAVFCLLSCPIHLVCSQEPWIRRGIPSEIKDKKKKAKCGEQDEKGKICGKHKS